jgi:hypothetical protein
MNWANTRKSLLPYALLSDLEANTVYEYQVRGFCGELGNGASNIGEFTTPALAQEDIACGLPQNMIDLTNQVPKVGLTAGDTLLAADFDIKISKITNSAGGSGRYSGEGLMVFPLANRAKVKVRFDNILVNNENRFIEGKIVVVGMGIQVLSDEMINNVNVLFSEIDALLAQAETTLTKIDEALAKMEQLVDMMIKYLPDDLLQELKSSQAALELAKDEYDRIKNDPNASETDKAKAKENLKKAREAVKKAYGDAATYWKEALVKFVKILWRATRELGQEATSSLNQINGFKQNKTAFNNQNNIVIPSSSEEDSYTITESVNIVDENTVDSQTKEKLTQARSLMDKEQIIALGMVISKMINVFSNEESMQQLGEGLKEKGFDVMEEILQKLKMRKSEDEIVNFVKTNIKNKVFQLILD